MARRKTFLHAPQQDPNGTHNPFTSPNGKVSVRDYYNKRYEEVDKSIHRQVFTQLRPTHTLIGSRACGESMPHNPPSPYVVEIDPYYTLRKATQGRIKNFFHWMCNNFSVGKIGLVSTYWHQLSQLYIKWKGRRINPLILKQIFDFICNLLAEEYGLDDSETDKPLLDAEDFLEVLRCHWVTDMNVFPHERQRVQLATILLLAALTGSRPGALLGITYRDLDLFIQRDKKTGEVALTLKTYTFFIDTNPLFCVISYIVCLACDDDAYAFADMTPGTVLTLGVRKGLNCQPIPWKEDIIGIPVFRAAVQTDNGRRTSPDEALSYGRYHEWVKRLGEETGFVQVFTTYCLRRATGNAINAAYRGTASRTELIRAAYRMSRLIDPRRPKGPTDEQRQNLRRDAEIQELCDRRDQLYQSIRHDFRFFYRAKGEPIHDEYEEIKRAIERLLKARERELKKQVQAEFDATAPVQDIRAQLAGTAESMDPIFPIQETPQYAFAERSRIATAFFDALSVTGGDNDVNWRISIVDDMVLLYTRREGHYRKPPRLRKT
ncbi:MAG: hypothetical protein Q9217_006433 [Psora testacea]